MGNRRTRHYPRSTKLRPRPIARHSKTINGYHDRSYLKLQTAKDILKSLEFDTSDFEHILDVREASLTSKAWPIQVDFQH